jgi:GNAT superfamily N-acetyltransferase
VARKDERDAVAVEVLPAAAAGDAARVAAVVRVINAAYAVGEAGLWVDGTVRTTPAAVAEAIRGGGMLVASLDGEVVGCAWVKRLDATTADVGLVSVVPERWGSGAGRALVAAAEELMRAGGVTTAQLDLLVPRDWVHPEKARLRAWYERLGYTVVRVAPFEEIGVHDVAELATPCRFLVFTKRLAPS